jgi:hypothetical protein
MTGLNSQVDDHLFRFNFESTKAANPQTATYYVAIRNDRFTPIPSRLLRARSGRSRRRGERVRSDP